MYEDLFQYKKLNIEKAIAFGFQKIDGVLIYTTSILDEQFILQVSIENSKVTTKVLEKDSGEEYILYKTSAEGSFVGTVREVVQDVLQKVFQNCYEAEIFKTTQAKELIKYVRERFVSEPEFLWEKFPANAVWRRKDNKKWYGAILTVAGNKLGLPTKDIVEIVDLRVQPENLEEILKLKGYYPGWHMNKKSWYTIVLDDTVPSEEIFRRINESFELAKK